MSLQSRLREALLDPAAVVPPEVTSWNGSDPAQRFAVYRNNVTVSLIEALGASYPVVKAMVGEDFFRDMARLYLRAHPPRSPMMMGYGAGFADFLARFEPVAGLPYLPDLARLEDARRRAYHARDAVSLGPQDFAGLDDSSLLDLRLTFHPSAVILRSDHAVVSLWGAHQGLYALEDIALETPEDALILRPAFEVEVIALPPGGAAFLADLETGRTLGAAVEALSPAHSANLPTLMSLLVGSGVVLSHACQKEA